VLLHATVASVARRIASGWTNNLVIRDTIFVGFNTSDTYALTTCCHCNFPNSKNQGTKTTHFEGVQFVNSQQVVKYAQPMRAILRDVDGSLSGTPGVFCRTCFPLLRVAHTVGPESCALEQ
jgi:hypothetical protein